MATRFALAAVLVTLCQPAVAGPVPINLGPGQPQAYAWQANESWPGGPLADARLDRPVRFWRAGLLLPEVFASIEKQTGVAIRTWPPQDPIARMRVNLYLNDAHPPTLREVLAQLSWAVRASFACTAGPERRYYLLGIGEIGGEWARLAAAREARDRREQEQARQNRERMVADIEKYRPALGLSREEAIRSLQDTDPLLLLTLISPVRRMTLQLLCALRPEQLTALAAEGELRLKLSDLPAALCDELVRALELHDPVEQYAVEFHAESDGIWAAAESPDQSAELGPEGKVLLSPGRPLDLWYQLALHDELFGEDDPQREQFMEALQAQWERGSRERERREFAANVEASRQLTGEAATRLSALVIHWDGNTGYAMWRLQEAVARATGMNIVSDCFNQAATNPVGPLVQLDPAYEAKLKQWSGSLPPVSTGEAEPEPPRPPMPSHEVSVLNWLTAYCFFNGEFSDTWSLEEQTLGWEWGDAGPFVRFRVQCPDIWRGVMLPEPVEKAIEEAIRPYLKIAAEGSLPREIPFPLDLRTQVWIVGETDMLQRPGAACLIRDDPAAPLGALHNYLAAAVVRQITQEVGALNWLTTVREDQWKALRTTGLCGTDLIEEQRTKWYIAHWLYGVTEPEQKAEALRRIRIKLLPSKAGVGLKMLEIRGPGGEVMRSEFFPAIRTDVVLPPAPLVSRRE